MHLCSLLVSNVIIFLKLIHHFLTSLKITKGKIHLIHRLGGVWQVRFEFMCVMPPSHPQHPKNTQTTQIHSSSCRLLFERKETHFFFFHLTLEDLSKNLVELLTCKQAICESHLWGKPISQISYWFLLARRK